MLLYNTDHERVAAVRGRSGLKGDAQIYFSFIFTAQRAQLFLDNAQGFPDCIKKKELKD